jgi:hypothetical protein
MNCLYEKPTQTQHHFNCKKIIEYFLNTFFNNKKVFEASLLFNVNIL